MNDILLFAVLALGFFSCCLWSERVKYQRENGGLKQANERLKTTFNALQMDYSRKERALTEVEDDFDQYRDDMSNALTIFTSELSRIADEYLPAVESPSEILLRMTPEQIANGDIIVGHEFVRFFAQASVYKGEAVNKLYEVGLRAAIGIKRQGMVGMTTPASVKHMGAYLKRMQEIMEVQAPALDAPLFKQMLIYAYAYAMNEMKEALLNGKQPPSADDIELATEAFDYVVAHKPEAPPTTVNEVASEEIAETEPPSFSVNGHRAKRAKEGVSAHG